IFTVSGTATEPTVLANDVTVDNASIEEFHFDRLSASLEYGGPAGKRTLLLSNLAARTGDATITGQAELGPNHTFRMSDFIVSGVDLKRIQPYVSDYVAVTGTAQLSADVSGTIQDGKAVGLHGVVQVSTNGLIVNGETFGDLRGTIALDGSVIRSEDLAIGPAGSGIRVEIGRAHV